MANVKQIVIEGTVPFNIHEHPDATNIWANFSAPAVGLRIRYGRSEYIPNTSLPFNGGSEKEPNPDIGNTGMTAMYDFALEGCEGVSWAWLDNFYRVVEKYGGTITKKQVREL